MFLMNLMSERISSGSAVRTTCDMKKEATAETLYTLSPPKVKRGFSAIWYGLVGSVTWCEHVLCCTETYEISLFTGVLCGRQYNTLSMTL